MSKNLEIQPTEYSDKESRLELPLYMRLLRLTFYISLIVVPTVIFSAVNPVKQIFFDATHKISDLGIGGYFILILIIGVIIIPSGLPYVYCEMSISMIYQNYPLALGICMASKFVGTIVCFFSAKGKLRKILMYILKEQKIYPLYGLFEKLTQEKPWCYSFLIRGVLMPLFLKNFLLAFVDGISFWKYLVAMIGPSLVYSSIQIALFRQFSDFLTCTKTLDTDEIIYAVVFGVLSGIIALVLGVSIYRAHKKSKVDSTMPNSPDSTTFQKSDNSEKQDATEAEA